MPEIIYDLYGIISYIKNNSCNYNYIASCKSYIDNNWYQYNDTNVKEISNVQKDIIEFGNPYILFYKKNSMKINIINNF